jgi:hypothetical protein
MPKKTFGSRSRPPAGSSSSNDGNDKYSKVDFLRGVIAASIQQYDTVAPAERDSLAMRIRVLQDQLAELKRLSSSRTHRSDDLAWVDIWRPAGRGE